MQGGESKMAIAGEPATPNRCTVVVEGKRNRHWAWIGIATTLYAALAVLFTYPLLFRLDEVVLGWPGDNFEYVWKMWWVKRAILDLHTTPFFAPQIYYPYGYNMANAELTPTHTVLALPLTALLGPVVSYNLAILGSFVLSGLGMYLLITAYTARVGPALIGGLAFGFSPYRVAHSVGHLPLMGTGWIPLTFWTVERWWATRRPGWAALGGLCAALACLSSWYYALFMILALGVFFLIRLQPWRRAFWQPATLVGGALFAVSACVLILPFALPYYQVMAEGGLTHDFGSALAVSARPTDLLVPNLLHPLWGGLLQRAFPSQMRMFVERSVYLGWVALALAGVAVVGKRRSPAVWAWAAVGALAILVALGPLLTWRDQEVTFSIPAAAQTVLVRIGAWPFLQRFTTNEGRFVVPLPALVLRQLVPGFASIRAWARMALFATLAVSVLAGLGLDRLCDRLAARGLRRVGRVGTWAVAGLLLLDLIAIPPLWPGVRTYTAPTGPRPVDTWLARQPDGALVEFPLSLSGPPLYHTITHGKSIVTGYGTFVPAHYQAAYPVLSSFPSPESLSLLASWGVRYVLVDGGRYGGQWPALKKQLDAIDALTLAHEAEGIYVYLLR
jgi:hypothetical protein